MEAYPQAEKFALSLAEISDGTGLSVAYLRNEVRRGALPIKKFGRRILVLKKDLNAYLDAGSPARLDEHAQA
jgi:excisionase family DNA binding protein